MKVIYAGACNSLASKLVDRLVKEEDQIYIISNEEFDVSIKPALKYKLYRYHGDDFGLGKIFSSIKPDVVVFAGEIYMGDQWEYNNRTNAYLSGLLNILNLSLVHNIQKFIYLSTVEVYPIGTEICVETDVKTPLTYKGQLCSFGEDMVLSFNHNYSMDTVILRMDNIYGCTFMEKQQDFLTSTANNFYTKDEFEVNCNKYLRPIHIKDCVDAIFRAKNMTSSLIYNVSGPKVLTEVRIAGLLGVKLKMEDKVKEVEGPFISRTIDCSSIKRDLEWVCYHEIETSLSNQEIDLTQKDIKAVREKRKALSKAPVITLENIVIFLIFCGLTAIFKNFQAFNAFNPMIIYIVSIALLLGTRQVSISVILASGAYVLAQNGLKDWNNLNVLSSAEFIITVVQYMFIGVAVGYTVEHSRTIISEKENENDFFSKELQEVQEINDDNIKIKREYEKRILTYKTSLPKLYSIISRLTVLEPEKIFVEAIDVIKDIMDTDTVAVYLANDRNSYIRLIASSNSDAIFHGKSINMDHYSKMKDMLHKNELFVGSQWDESEPSLAAPIFYEGKCIAVIIINEMKFSGLNLYQMNLFRTLTILIASSVAKAKDYESAVRSTQYIEDTEILNHIEFEKLVDIKKEGKAKGIANYSILKLKGNETIKDTFYKVANLARNTYFFGTNHKQELLVLLSNTSADEVPFVRDRFHKAEIETEVVNA